MASPQRFSEMTDPGGEPMLVDEDFEMISDDADLPPTVGTGGSSSSGAAGWILFSLLVTACTATVLLVGLPMRDELDALRGDKRRLSTELATTHAREEDLAAELVNLEAARVRLTAALAQKSVELEEALRARADVERRLTDEIKRLQAASPASTQAPPRRRTRRR